MAGQIISKVAAGGGTHLVAPSAYFVCDTAAATQAKIAKCADTNINAFVPVHGTTIAVRFVNSNTYNGTVTLTLQTNGGTQILAAHNLYRYGTTNVGTDVTNSWNANSIVTLTYDTALNSSGYWIMNNWLNNNTTYSSQAAASGGTAVSLVTTGEKYIWNNKSNLAIGTTATTAAKGNHTHSFTPAGTIAVQTAGSTNSTLKPVTAKTMVKSGVFTKIGTTAVSGSTLDLTDVITAVSLATEDSVTLGSAVTVKTGDATYKFTGTAGTTRTPA